VRAGAERGPVLRGSHSSPGCSPSPCPVFGSLPCPLSLAGKVAANTTWLIPKSQHQKDLLNFFSTEGAFRTQSPSALGHTRRKPGSTSSRLHGITAL